MKIIKLFSWDTSEVLYLKSFLISTERESLEYHPDSHKAFIFDEMSKGLLLGLKAFLSQTTEYTVSIEDMDENDPRLGEL